MFRFVVIFFFFCQNQGKIKICFSSQENVRMCKGQLSNQYKHRESYGTCTQPYTCTFFLPLCRFHASTICLLSSVQPVFHTHSFLISLQKISQKQIRQDQDSLSHVLSHISLRHAVFQR